MTETDPTGPAHNGLGARRRREEGQIATALTVIVLLGVLLIIMRVLLPIGEAANRKNQAVTAADSAALAGLDQVRDDVLDAIFRSPLSLLSPDALRDRVQGAIGGCPTAPMGDYALRNDADVTNANCHFAGGKKRVWVEVRGRTPTKGGDRAVSRATAELAVGPTCTVPAFVPPVQTPSPTTSTITSGTSTTTTTSTSSPAPPSDIIGELRCGDLEVRIEIDGVTGRVTLLTTEHAVQNHLEPRLVR